MQKTHKDIDLHLPHIDVYRKVLSDHSSTTKIAEIERYQFYERAKNAYAIVHSGFVLIIIHRLFLHYYFRDTAKYGNIILTKGLVDYKD